MTTKNHVQACFETSFEIAIFGREYNYIITQQ